VYFWISLLALCVSPFLYNPHQFAWNDFFIDYRDYLRWLSRGNSRSHSSSWIAYCRLSRTRLTGYKRKLLGEKSANMSGDVPRARFTNLFFGEIVGPLILVGVTFLPYLFINAQTGVTDENVKPTQSVIRLMIVAFAPIAVNAGVLAAFFGMACCMGPVLSMCCKKFGSVLAAIAHAISVIMLIVFFEVMMFLEGFNFTRALLGMVASAAIQRFIYKLIISLALTREFKSDHSNIAFWTGKWYSMGWHSVSQPAREFLCKITELGMFAGDFVLGHMLLFAHLPFIIIPKIDMIHSMMLFWLRPSRQIRPPIYTLKQSKLRRRRVWRFAVMYFLMFVLFLALIIGPIMAGKALGDDVLGDTFKGNDLIGGLFQPNNGTQNDTGPSNTEYLASQSEALALLTTTVTDAAEATATDAARRLIKLF
jgi:1,3-beta-glucan synthase